ncbi:MAG: endonuclease/exonuclease/phosphatase family protein [Gammaproteobacteria bacterium]|nr:endonuclease/exonuclease/phosphatase family protein [Gammaproteobacteria bacterium]MDH5591700.1 endonuclease/exonuclease/phosphatase family protein [Gammaproteobacteria bacterium]
MQENQLRILTYNLHKGFSVGNRHFILHQIREALVDTGADILFLQEMQGEHTEHEQTHHNWPECSHSDFLAEDVWPHVAYGKNAVYKVGHHGNAILSKHAFHSWENINVSPYVWASRSLLHAVIRLPEHDDDLHIICIHLGLIGAERRRQFDTLCKRIDGFVPHDAPLIVAGDFNDWTGQAEKRFYKHLKLKEAFRTLHSRYAKTWPAWFPMLPMDRIYYRGIQPVHCERPNHALWKSLSDHAPLLATFKL